MPEDVDLTATVEEVKDQIRELEDPDYEALLEAEKEGKDRKTVKEFIQRRIDDEGVEVEEAEDQVVEEIEQETRGGLLGGFSKDTVLTAGILLGIVAGLVFGLGIGQYTAGDADITTAQAEEKFISLMDAQPDSPDYEVASVERQSGMFFITVEITETVMGENETEEEQTVQQGFYMTGDGELLFPQQEQFGQVVSPINIDEEIDRLQDEEEGSEEPEEELDEELQEEFEEELEDLE